MTLLLPRTKIWLLFPVAGSILFVILYIIATFLYPGGSAVDPNAAGFSWMNNYWCNLLEKYAINGESNTGRPFAIIAMFMLCFSLAVFWFISPLHIGIRAHHRLIIQIAGIAAMASSFLLLTNLDHDLVVNTSSTLGFIATIGTIAAMYERRWNRLFIYGLLNVFLVALNNYLYYAKGMMFYLPFVQKISFISFLVWFCMISIALYRKPVVLA